MPEKHESLDRNQESGPFIGAFIITILPKTIKILHRDYDLLEYTQIETLTNGDWGSHDPISGVIKYNKATQGSETADTILHEVLHAVGRLMDIEFKDKNEEESIIRKLATGLVTVLKDNPKLLDALVTLIRD